MKLGIMQPYFFPYIGYWQLINAVDTFVVYDNIQFTKKGWIHRNRILVNGKDSLFSLPLQKGSDFLDIRERHISPTWIIERGKILRRIESSYKKAPFFSETIELVERCMNHNTSNLFDFLLFSLENTMLHLGLRKPTIISSSINMDHTLKSQERVIEICKKIGANFYINPIGGKQLYNSDTFKNNLIELRFIKRGNISYQQLKGNFIPDLSIIDVLMFNGRHETKRYLEDYFLEL